MDRKSFASILDEAVGKLEGDVRALKNQQAVLAVNLKDLEARRDKLSGEIVEGEKKLSDVENEYRGKVDAMLKSAQDKLTSANLKDTEVAAKNSELSEKIKEYDNLIKSNQGLQKNLNAEKENIKNITVKFNKLTEIIKETIKDI